MEKKEIKARLYNHERIYEAFKEKLSSEKTENNKVILKWLRFMELRDLKIATRLRRGQHIKTIDGLVNGKSFKKLKTKDMEELIVKINNKYTNNNTNRDLKRLWKLFFKWFKGTDYFPPEVAWIVVPKLQRVFEENDFLTEEETARLIEAEINPMYKALWAFFASTGARTGEIMTLRRKDVKDIGDCLIVFVDDKTGPRNIPSFLYLDERRKWLDKYPLKDDQPLFYAAQTDEPKSISHSRMIVKLRKVAKKAGIDKQVTPYAIRHSSIKNDLADEKGMKIVQEKHGTSMLDHYAKLTSKDVENAERKFYIKRFGDKPKLQEDVVELAYLLFSNKDVLRVAFKHLREDKAKFEQYKKLRSNLLNNPILNKSGLIQKNEAFGGDRKKNKASRKKRVKRE